MERPKLPIAARARQKLPLDSYRKIPGENTPGVWLQVEKDELLYVWDFEGEGDCYARASPYSDKSKQGFVVVGDIQLGERSLASKVILKETVKDLVNVEISDESKALIANDIFSRTAATILAGVARSRLLAQMKQRLRAIVLSPAESGALIKETFEGMPEELRQAAVNNAIRLDSFRTLPKAADTGGGGIYIIVYRRDGMDTGLYIGKSVSFMRRSYGHWQKIRSNDTGIHYVRARKYFTEDEVKSKSTPTRFHCVVLSKMLFDASAESDAKSRVTEALWQAMIGTEIAEPTQNEDNPGEDIESCFANLRMFTDWERFRDIVKAAVKKTGWNVLRFHRDGICGMNTTLPLTEASYRNIDEAQQVQVTKTYLPTKDVYRYTTLRRASAQHGSGDPRIQAQWSLGGKRHAMDILITKWPMKPGDYVSVVVELSHMGTFHPFPYSSCPRIGPFSNWEDQKRLGIALEWKDKLGQMRRGYLHASAKAARTHGYLVYMALLRDLEKREFKGPGPSELTSLPFQPPNVTSARFDPMQNAIITTEQQPLPPESWPRKLTIQETGAMLSQGGCQKIGPPPQDLGFLSQGVAGPRRVLCDYCYLFQKENHATSMSTKQCDKTGSCQRCKAIGRPCTWTNSIELRNDPGLQRTILGFTARPTAQQWLFNVPNMILPDKPDEEEDDEVDPKE